MATATRKRPARSLRYYPGHPALLVITEGARTDDYLVGGLGLPGCYRLRKCPAAGADPADCPSYDVDLHAGSCECKGHLRWGHRTRCRHLAALLALEGAGRL
jgi:hypothetical protein